MGIVQRLGLGRLSVASFLLPPAARFGAQRLSPAAAAALGRAALSPRQAPGGREQLRKYFDFNGSGWPIAALARRTDAGDAAEAAWLRADPAWLRPDINGVRLMAWGQGLETTGEDVDALLPALRPLFGDAGFSLDAPHPARWYLRLPRGTRVPDFPDPDQALGEDLFERADTTPEGRKWRALASEAQVILHNHPWNARRAERGLAPVNALWFWGGGVLPVPEPGDNVVHAWHGLVWSDDEVVRVLALDACGHEPLPPAFGTPLPGSYLYDLRHLRDLAAFERDWLLPALDALRSGALTTLILDDADGRIRTLTYWSRLRLWRRPRPSMDA